MFRAVSVIGKQENSHILLTSEALDPELHSTDVILLDAFNHIVRWASYKGGTKAQRGPEVTQPASGSTSIPVQSF